VRSLSDVTEPARRFELPALRWLESRRIVHSDDDELES